MTDDLAPVTYTLEYPYTRTPGPVLGPFLTGLRDGTVYGNRIAGKVYVPPLEYDPADGSPAEGELVEVGPAGTIQSWTWVTEPTQSHPFDHPFAFAQILLDGADVPFVHAVDTGSPDKVSTGARVTARYADERVGAITDVWFVPEDEAVEQTIEPGEGQVEITTSPIALDITEPLQPHRQRFAQALLDGKFLGQKSPVTGKIYVPSRGYDQMERVEMTEADDIVLNDRGAVAAYTVITPVQYHGQLETEPYIRASVLLDGCDSALGQIDIRDIPEAEMRVGLRLQAVWKKADQRSVEGIDNRGVGWEGVIDRWEPTGEPDDDPRKLEDYAF